MNAPGKQPSPEQLLRALRHPLRRQILRALKGTKSPAQLATSLHAPLSLVSYHVRVLRACGALKEAGTREVRGAVEHFYRLNIEVGWVRSALEAEDDSAQPSS